MKTFRFSAPDILGAIALEAERIVGAAKLHAHGGIFPDPDLIAITLARMGELNQLLLDQKKEISPVPNGSAAVN